MPPLGQPLVTLLLIIATAMVQLVSQLLLDRAIAALPRARPGWFIGFNKMAFTIVAVVILIVGHLVQVTIWAIRYYAWGELGNFFNSFYFSLASFTTMGANEFTLSPVHRFAGAVESAIGMLMFGWSTALLFDIIQRAGRE